MCPLFFVTNNLQDTVESLRSGSEELDRIFIVNCHVGESIHWVCHLGMHAQQKNKIVKHKRRAREIACSSDQFELPVFSESVRDHHASMP